MASTRAAAVAVLALVAGAAVATAQCPEGGGMRYESRFWEGGMGVTPSPPRPTATTVADYESFFYTLSQDSGYCTRDDITLWSAITNKNVCPIGSNRNIAFMISFSFVAPVSATYHFRFGADMGGGGFMRVDDTVLEADLTMDLWYAGDFSRTAETLEGSIALDEGTTHTLVIHGYEACCDGAQELQFSTGGDYGTVSCENLGTIPEEPVVPGGEFECDGEGFNCKFAKVSSVDNSATISWASTGTCPDPR